MNHVYGNADTITQDALCALFDSERVRSLIRQGNYAGAYRQQWTHPQFIPAEETLRQVALHYQPHKFDSDGNVAWSYELPGGVITAVHKSR